MRTVQRVHGLAELIVAKQRHGATGKVRMRFESRITRFSDLASDVLRGTAMGTIDRKVMPEIIRGHRVDRDRGGEGSGSARLGSRRPRPQRGRGEGARRAGGGMGDAAAAVVLDAGEGGAAARIVEQAAARFGRRPVVDCRSNGPAGYRLTGRFRRDRARGHRPVLTNSPPPGSSGWPTPPASPDPVRRGGTLVAHLGNAGRFAAPSQMVGAARAATVGFVRNREVLKRRATASAPTAFRRATSWKAAPPS